MQPQGGVSQAPGGTQQRLLEVRLGLLPPLHWWAHPREHRRSPWRLLSASSWNSAARHRCSECRAEHERVTGRDGPATQGQDTHEALTLERLLPTEDRHRSRAAHAEPKRRAGGTDRHVTRAHQTGQSHARGTAAYGKSLQSRARARSRHGWDHREH